eukprot:gene3674-4229_t
MPISASGVVQIGESLNILVELITYTNIDVDIYSTLHIKGGMEFTLFCHIESDPYLPLFLQACNGNELTLGDHDKMYDFIKENPAIMKTLQELAHSMISDGRYLNPKSFTTPLPKYIHSRVRISKYNLTFGKSRDKPAIIYQLLTDKFLISNSGSNDITFQFHQTKCNKYNLSMVPANGVLGKGEWFYIRCSLTAFEQTDLNEVIQIIINQREVHHILVSVRCENIHSGNKEIDVDKELLVQDRLGSGAAGDVYSALISSTDLKNHISRISFEQGKWLRRSPSDTNVVVAVKKLYQFVEPSQEMIQDFYSEVKVLSMLNHPNIVKYVGGCTKIGNWSIVMEYLPGGNLMDVLADRIVDLPFKLVLKMALDIAQGIHYLHSLGILHLDLKSPNLLVASLSMTASVHIKVADFNTCINRSRITGYPDQRPMFDAIIHALTTTLAGYEIEEQKAKASFRGLRRNHSGSSLIVTPSLGVGSPSDMHAINMPIKLANKPMDPTKSTLRLRTKRHSQNSFINNNSALLPFKFSPPPTPKSSFLGVTTKIDEDLKKVNFEEKTTTFLKYKPSYIKSPSLGLHLPKQTK